MPRSARARRVAPRPETPRRLLPEIDRKAIAIFVGAVLILLAPWPGCGRVFRTFFSGFGNAVLAVTGAGAASEPSFSSSPPAALAADPGLEHAAWTVWAGAARGPLASGPPVPLDTRILGYTPLAVLLALVAASAIPRRRRAAVLGIGASLLLFRLAVAIAMAVGRGFGQSAERPGAVAEIVWYLLVDLPAMSYVAPLAAWVAGLAATEASASRRVSSIRT
ncbi:MAG TPA: hypothetical protein VMT03_16810 [Polyangia bacterium]|nr:hypothetical protein [Polyangia bacterium]